MSSIIKVENLSKRFFISHEGMGKQRYTALRDVMAQKASKIFSFPKSLNTNPAGSGQREEFWALKDLNFEIQQGDRVGIIGRNGAGKSTLLKVLSRITEPTRGRIEIMGRVASLLEVGTGFHPELTGRENIFLNGAILGMSRAEIKKKFDEIVDFAEIERFLDTPVKRYSSGMYVRLAFAVAAHLEPEILVVDEVLAVGDSQFQKKCLGKMQEVSKSGRTILFVSHNMAAIQNLCSFVMFMQQGKLISYGPTKETITLYLNAANTEKTDLSNAKNRVGNGKIKFENFEIRDAESNTINTLLSGSYARFKFYLRQKEEAIINNIIIAVGINNELGERIAHLSNETTGNDIQGMQPGLNEIDLILEKVPFKAGNYTIDLFISENGAVADWINEAGVITVEMGDFYGTGKLPPDEHSGDIYIEHSFTGNI